MFIAIYEFDVKDGMEQKFAEAWLELTKGIYQNHGSFGSRLHKDEGGKYIGYAQWPDKETWARDWSSENDLKQARETMWSCLNSSTTVYEASVVSDYLQPDQYERAPGKSMEE